ncbi:MAG: bifunctional 3,4-dihydroxy-2-butanone-4-phosphate synthase/GTP cyclohydrolase II [Pseudonocardiaceae bacterium]|nr:bifunctional 3,4-dihydroxy-2-butanone-4-phosphate synthase/GTP cyclohydrolase II [Pseudonocardiaceae bacterium]
MSERMDRVDGVSLVASDIAAGKPVVVLEDAADPAVGSVVCAAGTATAPLIAFTIRHTTGFVQVPLIQAHCDRLNLPPMSGGDHGGPCAGQRVSVDARDGVTTGISASDRARTIRVLADPHATADALARPGHVVPLCVPDGGVLRRPGRCEAAADLAALAGLPPAGVLSDVVSTEDRGELARRDELRAFAGRHDMRLVTVTDLVRYRRRTEARLIRSTEEAVPTQLGTFRAISYDSWPDGSRHVALTMGNLGDGQHVSVWLHHECPAGTVLGTLGCLCRQRLDAGLTAIATKGRGALRYLRRPTDEPDPPLTCPNRKGCQTEPRDGATAALILADLGIPDPLVGRRTVAEEEDTSWPHGIRPHRSTISTWLGSGRRWPRSRAE